MNLFPPSSQPRSIESQRSDPFRTIDRRKHDEFLTTRTSFNFASLSLVTSPSSFHFHVIGRLLSLSLSLVIEETLLGCYFSSVCARAHTHTCKLFRCRRSVLTIILLFTYSIYPPFFHSSLHTPLRAMHRVRALLCLSHPSLQRARARVFSTHFAAVCNHRSPSSHTQQTETNIRTHTHTHTRTYKAQQSSLHIRPLQRMRFMFEERSTTRRQRHAHTHIRHVHTFSPLAGCRFFLLARQQRERHTTD